mgnify:CR=1 FL=1
MISRYLNSSPGEGWLLLGHICRVTEPFEVLPDRFLPLWQSADPASRREKAGRLVGVNIPDGGMSSTKVDTKRFESYVCPHQLSRPRAVRSI